MRSFIVIILLFCSFFPAAGETIIYENITTSQYKIITIDDDLNIQLINDYSYDVYLNNSFLGSYKKGEKIYIPDNMTVSIYIPDSNIDTDIGNIWDAGKVNFYIAIMYIGSGLVAIVIILYFIRKIRRG